MDTLLDWAKQGPRSGSQHADFPENNPSHKLHNSHRLIPTHFIVLPVEDAAYFRYSTPCSNLFVLDKVEVVRMQHGQLQIHTKEVEGIPPNFLPAYAQPVKCPLFESGN